MRTSPQGQRHGEFTVWQVHEIHLRDRLSYAYGFTPSRELMVMRKNSGAQRNSLRSVFKNCTSPAFTPSLLIFFCKGI